MEAIVLSNQASTAGTGNGATNRKLGAFRAWLASNDAIGSGGASGGYNTSTNVVDAATNGTQRAFTKAILDSMILSTYNAGGMAKTLMVSPYVKTVFSTFMADSNVAPQRYETPQKGQTTIVAAADMYLSDFGPVSVVPNRQMARAGATIARNAFFIDPRMVSLGVFDDIQLQKPAKTGDAEKRVLVTEYTLLGQQRSCPRRRRGPLRPDLRDLRSASQWHIPQPSRSRSRRALRSPAAFTPATSST
jgi:hypothetical protein